jgi:hypothetical protein
VLFHHLCEVHAVDVVGADHYDDVRVGVVDEVQGLVDGVGAAQEPALAHALLGRNRSHVVAELGGHAPRLGDVAVKAVRLVLREHHDLQVAGIHEVGQREVDQAVTSGKGHAGFGPVCRQRHQPVSLAAREDNGQDFLFNGMVAPVRLRNSPKQSGMPGLFTLEQLTVTTTLGNLCE